MAVKVQDIGKHSPVVAGDKPIPNKTKSSAASKKSIFENILSSMKVKTGESSRQKTTIAAKPYRPATSMITNSGQQKTSGTQSTQDRSAQSLNTMAASALISLAAVSSGANRMSSLYSMGSGITGQPGSVQSSSAAVERAGSAHGQEIGSLSAKFESGERGPEVIGFDSRGGTSYGTFQISSKAGTMRRFIDYLSEKAPDLARKFHAAGPANTGGRKGRMPELWKKVAGEEPERFSKLQYDFIEQTHYLPAVREIEERTGIDIGQSPKALKEVLWSTAVQHGPNGAAKIFSKAVGRGKAKSGTVKAAELINSVYRMRAGQFGSSSSQVRSAVLNRFRQEGKLALAMLSEPYQQSDSVRV